MTVATKTQRCKVRSYKTLDLDRELQATDAEQEWNHRKAVHQSKSKVCFHSGLQPPAR